jgi:hypothetical protein
MRLKEILILLIYLFNQHSFSQEEIKKGIIISSFADRGKDELFIDNIPSYFTFKDSVKVRKTVNNVIDKLYLIDFNGKEYYVKASDVTILEKTTKKELERSKEYIHEGGMHIPFYLIDSPNNRVFGSLKPETKINIIEYRGGKFIFDLNGYKYYTKQSYIKDESLMYFFLKNKCDYEINKYDEFENKKRILTTQSVITDLNNSGSLEELALSLYRLGSSKYLIINSNMTLGCVSPYKHNRSKVEFKLENGQIVSFYHSGDVDCAGRYKLEGRLTYSDEQKLKASNIKSVRLTGTDYYHDITSLKWKTFFKDKLDCLK